MRDTNGFSETSAGKNNNYGDFPETAVFELEKLAVTLSKVPGPTHQLLLRMRTCTLTVRLCCPLSGPEMRRSRLAVCPLSASWRLQVADPALTKQSIPIQISSNN